MRSAFPVVLLVVLLVPVISGQGCSWKCPNGRRAMPREGHEPSSNGCGIDGLRISSQFDFTKCCDQHDFCFTTCGTSFDKCNDDFEKCMMSLCDSQTRRQRESCRSTASMYSIGVVLGGCSFYQDSQRDACDCGDGYVPKPTAKAAVAGDGAGNGFELDLGQLFSQT